MKAVTQTQLCALVRRAGGKLSADTIQRCRQGKPVKSIPYKCRNIDAATSSPALAVKWAKTVAEYQRCALRVKAFFDEGTIEHNAPKQHHGQAATKPHECRSKRRGRGAPAV